MERDICSYLNADMKVLELAAGPGIMSSKIAAHCGFLEITDFSLEMLKQAQKKKIKGNINFAVADVTRLTYSDESFDAIVIANALHIMPNPQKALDEIRRVLTKDGLLIAPTFTRDEVKSKWKEQIMNLAGFHTYSNWTKNSYPEFIDKQGYKVIDSHMIYGHNFPICFVACKKEE